jgi:hypothetical protein
MFSILWTLDSILKFSRKKYILAYLLSKWVPTDLDPALDLQALEADPAPAKFCISKRIQIHYSALYDRLVPVPVLIRLNTNKIYIFSHLTKNPGYLGAQSTPQCMSPRRNWDSPNPSLASECAPPPRTGRGGGHSRLRVRGSGSPNSDDW